MGSYGELDPNASGSYGELAGVILKRCLVYPLNTVKTKGGSRTVMSVIGSPNCY
jgi:hypothetical protein